MERRELLTGISTGLAVSIGGCITNDGCVGETWTGVGYDIRLGEISYDETVGEWTGVCSLTVDINFARGSGSGITNAGIAIYSEGAHRIDLVSFGDMTWEEFPEENRSEMNCGGHQQGHLTRSEEFTVEKLPYYFGLWYSEIRAGVSEGASSLQYAQDTSSTPDSVSTTHWETVNNRSPDSFPPLPEHAPTLGEGISTGELSHYNKRCRETELQITNTGCCDLTIVGSHQARNPASVPRLKQVTLNDERRTMTVEIEVRGYQRPPEPDCETTYLEYTIDTSVEEELPDTVEVLHVDSEGVELERRTISPTAE